MQQTTKTSLEVVAPLTKIVRECPPPKYGQLIEGITAFGRTGILETADGYISFFGFCHEAGLYDFYSLEFVKSLADYLSVNWPETKMLEVCAGDGRLTEYLRWAGIEMLPPTDIRDAKKSECDFQNKWYGEDVIALEALEAIDQFKPDLVICAWPPYGSSLPEDILDRGIPLVYIGEGEGGCCGGDGLWDFQNKSLDCSQWNLCRTDYWLVWNLQRHSRTLIFYPKKEVKNETRRTT